MSESLVLWVAKQPTGTSLGGDDIYNMKTIRALPKHLKVSDLLVARNSFFERLVAMAKGLPHPRYKYFSNNVVEEFLSASRVCQGIVVSWESFDFLPCFVDRPVTLIIHNVMSDTLRQIFRGNVVGRAAALQSARWERKVYNHPSTRLVVLSERDRRLVQSLAPSRRVTVAPPGCPPAAHLESHRFIPEVVVSGSFEWAPKRRDFEAIARQYDRSDFSLLFRHDLPLPVLTPPSLLTSMSKEITYPEFSEGLRIGLIPDTFLGGFKLKSTFYVSMNCIVASMSDIRSEFSGLPHADEFVHFVRDLRDVEKLCIEVKSSCDENKVIRWKEFQNACIRRFNWSTTANSIAATLV